MQTPSNDLTLQLNLVSTWVGSSWDAPCWSTAIADGSQKFSSLYFSVSHIVPNTNTALDETPVVFGVGGKNMINVKMTAARQDILKGQFKFAALGTFFGTGITEKLSG